MYGNNAYPNPAAFAPYPEPPRFPPYPPYPEPPPHAFRGAPPVQELNPHKRKEHGFPPPPPLFQPEFKRQKPLLEEGGDGGGESDGEEEEEGEAVNPYALFNFRISNIIVQKLKAKGIESLFPIQALTFDSIFEGKDLVGRARTGQGKTLAFVLPILESLLAAGELNSQRRPYGRPPGVLVLVPTRELAKQVHEDFEFLGAAVGLSTICVYGGAPYGPQEGALRRGVDVVVGTPGRVKDFLEKGTLNLKSLKFRVLDEADEMLNMGFVEDIEKILSYGEDGSSVQTLLFSATMPEWVRKIASKFLKENKDTVDLVGEEKMKACATVRHLLLKCVRSARQQLIPDVISCYSSGRAIVFTETKNEASELASILPGTARALHGDISQGQREITLAGFRSGKFNILVATDVAARGLDITDVPLIIQCEPPRDVETYIHRSGRTGRAGKTGVSVLLYDRKKEYMVPIIERKAGFSFERIPAPQPADIAKSSATTAAQSIIEVSDSVLSIFRSAAEEMLTNSRLLPVDLLAKAIAKVAGHTDVKRRSLITGQDDATTLMLQSGKCMNTPTFVFNCLRRAVPEDALNSIKGMSLTIDGMAAVFDVPAKLVDVFMAARGSSGRDGFTISMIDSLPELQVRPDRGSQGRGFGGRGGSGGRGGGGRGGGFSGNPYMNGPPGGARGGGSFNNGGFGGGAPSRGGFHNGGSWRGGRGRGQHK